MSRTRSRQIALQILYKNEFHSDSEGKNDKLDINFFIESENLSKTDCKFILDLLKGVQKHKTDIDTTIKKYARNWKKERISLVDLNIMRMAVFEILFYPDVPDKVALNEALELAKNFGEKNSVAFANGILNQVFKNKKLSF